MRHYRTTMTMGEGGNSVLEGDVTEEVAHALIVVDAPNGLGQEDADVHCLDLVALHLLDLVGHRVGHHHLMTGKGIGGVSEQATFIRDTHTWGDIKFCDQRNFDIMPATCCLRLALTYLHIIEIG